MEVGSSILGALAWLEGTLLGTAATVIAILAVAGFGLLMLGGRTDWRRGVRIVVGCFILFGAPAIAAGILSAAGSSQTDDAGTDTYRPAAAPAPSAVLSYEPSRQPRSVCWTCGSD